MGTKFSTSLSIFFYVPNIFLSYQSSSLTILLFTMESIQTPQSIRYGEVMAGIITMFFKYEVLAYL